MTAGSSATAALWVLAVLAGAMFVRAASQLLIPIAIAVLISYALEPLVSRLQRARIPRLLGAALLLLALVGGAAWGMYSLRDDIGEAAAAIPEGTRRLGDWLGIGATARQAQDAIQSPEAVQQGAGWLVAGAGHFTVVVFLTYFLLISGTHFKRRLVELAGHHLERRRIAIEVLDDINDQIQRFLLARAFTSVVVGAATWVALAALGVEQAAVWSVLAGAFNSIPYFGPVIVSGGLFAVAFLQFGEPVAALRVSAVALAITSLEGWLLTPPLLGKTERMHVVVIFLGVLLWTWLWGAWGTILAVPMLVVIKAVADHVEPLKPVSRLLAQ
jgi:predicted PurR-regulated permease PerM